MIQLEGRNPVLEAIKQGSVTLIRVQTGKDTETKIKVILDLASRKKISVQFITKKQIEKLSETGHHQGIIAIAQPDPQWGLEKVLKETGKEVCILLLDQVQDPHNLGAIIRTSEGAGVDGIIIPKKASATLSPIVHRVSMGGSLYVPVWQRSPYTAIKTLKDEGVHIIGVDNSANKDYYDENLAGPVAFVIGGEDRGINPTLLEKCDTLVRIPMRGRIGSLNVSVAAAIILYERMRQQESK